MAKIIHAGTKVQSFFDVVDDEGNVVKELATQPTNVPVVTSESLGALAQNIHFAWKQLQAEQAVQDAKEEAAKKAAEGNNKTEFPPPIPCNESEK